MLVHFFPPVAWSLLMDVSFRELRMAIYSNQDEQKRFRQLVVNTVLATDIMDRELKELRNARWAKAFKESSALETPKDVVDRKATIVIEHLIQASDVAHTMQHWHIFRKWNERLFLEMYKAYRAGRAEKDPSESWYEGEIGFFDFYIVSRERCHHLGKSIHCTTHSRCPTSAVNFTDSVGQKAQGLRRVRRFQRRVPELRGEQQEGVARKRSRRCCRHGREVS